MGAQSSSKLCKFCGQPILTHNPRAETCCARCRRAWQNEQRKAARAETARRKAKAAREAWRPDVIRELMTCDDQCWDEICVALCLLTDADPTQGKWLRPAVDPEKPTVVKRL